MCTQIEIETSSTFPSHSNDSMFSTSITDHIRMSNTDRCIHRRKQCVLRSFSLCSTLFENPNPTEQQRFYLVKYYFPVCQLQQQYQRDLLHHLVATISNRDHGPEELTNRNEFNNNNNNNNKNKIFTTLKPISSMLVKKITFLLYKSFAFRLNICSSSAPTRFVRSIN